MSDESSAPFDYQLFGLSLRSDFVIPELRGSNAGTAPDVRIRSGQSAAGSLIAIDGVADFRVAGGREIWVSVAPSVPERNVRLYLLGSAMGLLLHQRGMLPLHANAIEMDDRVVAFMGPSGSGKSTLASWFHDHGHAVVADDVCVVHFDDEGQPFVQPGLPRLRLWKEALEASGRDAAHFARSYAGDENWDKFDVPLDPAGAPRASKPLAAIYLLDSGPASRVEPLSGVVAAEALFANTYRGRFVAEAGEPKLHWEACVRLVRSTPIFRALRHWGLDLLDEESERLRNHVMGLPRDLG